MEVWECVVLVLMAGRVRILGGGGGCGSGGGGCWNLISAHGWRTGPVDVDVGAGIGLGVRQMGIGGAFGAANKGGICVMRGNKVGGLVNGIIGGGLMGKREMISGKRLLLLLLLRLSQLDTVDELAHELGSLLGEVAWVIVVVRMLPASLFLVEIAKSALEDVLFVVVPEDQGCHDAGDDDDRDDDAISVHREPVGEASMLLTGALVNADVDVLAVDVFGVYVGRLGSTVAHAIAVVDVDGDFTGVRVEIGFIGVSRVVEGFGAPAVELTVGRFGGPRTGCRDSLEWHRRSRGRCDNFRLY